MSRSTIFAGQLKVTLVVAAMDEEVAPLRARLSGRTSGYLPGVRLTLGRLGRTPVALAVTGDGARNARGGLSRVLCDLPVSRVIVAGVSGGVTPDAEVGLLVLGDRIVDAHDGSVRLADESLVAAAARACHARRGVAVTAPRIADTTAEKARLREVAKLTCDGEAGPVAVDVESSFFVDEATRAGLPSLVLRAISDTADEPLPALLNRCRDEGGSIRRSRVALGLLGDPRPLAQLLVLRKRVSACALGLARALALVIAALEPADAAVETRAEAGARIAGVVGTEA
jgi:adenosylhomocysteine nucleosidase